jgi:hypothetical protein
MLCTEGEGVNDTCRNLGRRFWVLNLRCDIRPFSHWLSCGLGGSSIHVEKGHVLWKALNALALIQSLAFMAFELYAGSFDSV